MSKKENLEQLPAALPWVVGIAAVVLVVFYVGAFHRLPFTEDPSAWGAFGDYAGGLLNPLVSTFTLIVAVKVWRQQKIEMEETKKALKEQAKTAEQQRQEQRFFDLLNVYQQTVGSISLTCPHGAGEGSLGFLISNGKQAITDWLKKTGLDSIALFSGSGLSKHRVERQLKNHADLRFDHYFRVIHHLLCEAEALLGDQHIRYIELFRAQLSRSELIILGFNLWLNEDAKNMMPLIEKYGLLKYLPDGDLRKELQQHPKVFGSDDIPPATATT